MTANDTANGGPNPANKHRDTEDSAVMAEVDPSEFLQALLQISPEDAETVRQRAAEAMEREDRKRVKDAEGP